MLHMRMLLWLQFYFVREREIDRERKREGSKERGIDTMRINKEELRVFDATMWQMARGEFEIFYRFDLTDLNIHTHMHTHTHVCKYYNNNSYDISLYFIFDSIFNFTFCIVY